MGHDAPDIYMGKKSGLDNIAIWSKQMGIDLSEEEAVKVLKEVKRSSHDKRRVLSKSEFKEIVSQVKAADDLFMASLKTAVNQGYVFGI